MEEGEKGGVDLFLLCLLGLIKRMRIKIKEPLFLEGFDAALSREEGQKLTKLARHWAQAELFRDPSDRVWFRAQERGYFPSFGWNSVFWHPETGSSESKQNHQPHRQGCSDDG